MLPSSSSSRFFHHYPPQSVLDRVARPSEIDLSALSIIATKLVHSSSDILSQNSIQSLRPLPSHHSFLFFPLFYSLLPSFFAQPRFYFSTFRASNKLKCSARGLRRPCKTVLDSLLFTRLVFYAARKAQNWFSLQLYYSSKYYFFIFVFSYFQLSKVMRKVGAPLCSRSSSILWLKEIAGTSFYKKKFFILDGRDLLRVQLIGHNLTILSCNLVDPIIITRKNLIAGRSVGFLKVLLESADENCLNTVLLMQWRYRFRWDLHGSDEMTIIFTWFWLTLPPVCLCFKSMRLSLILEINFIMTFHWALHQLIKKSIK